MSAGTRGKASLTPFYARADAGTQSTRRLLVISYFFPPDVAVGGRRWEKFCHYAAERGWGIDVVMRGASELSADSPRLRALPTGVRVYAVRQPRVMLERIEYAVADFRRTLLQMNSAGASAGPGTPEHCRAASGSVARADMRWALHTPRGWLRLCWAWLDYATAGAWGRAAAATAAAIFRPGVHQAVIASSPPFMALDAASLVSRRCGIPSVLDMRDPWRHSERLLEPVATPLWLHLAARYESRAVRSASLVVANTELARRHLVESYPARDSDIITVTNGSDDDPLPQHRTGGKFIIAHAGTLYLDRDPRALFVAAARVVRDLDLTPDDIGLAFIGDIEAVGGFPIEDVARQEGILEYVSTGPLRPHHEAMKFMADANVLVTMSGSNFAAVPAKTFECVRFPAWVLALSEPGSATALLLEGTGADVVGPRDPDAIAAVICSRYEQHRAGVVPGPVGSDPRFSRRFQAEVLFSALEARLGGGARRAQRPVATAPQLGAAGSGGSQLAIAQGQPS